MKTLGFGLSALLLAAACTSDGPADASLTVVNDSDFVIEEIYLTDVDSSSWGANLLSNDDLFPDERLVLDVDCGLYDALLVDETGIECKLESIDLCLNDATWYISNNTCDAFEAALQERQRAAAH